MCCVIDFPACDFPDVFVHLMYILNHSVILGTFILLLNFLTFCFMDYFRQSMIAELIVFLHSRNVI